MTCFVTYVPVSEVQIGTTYIHMGNEFIVQKVDREAIYGLFKLNNGHFVDWVIALDKEEHSLLCAVPEVPA